MRARRAADVEAPVELRCAVGALRCPTVSRTAPILLVVLVLLVPLAAARPRPARRAVEAEDRLPRFGLTASAPRLETGCDDCRELVFRRPVGCELQRRTPGRKTYKCQREETRVVSIGAGGRLDVRRGATGPARNPYPLELVPQWRYCPFSEDAALEARLAPYEDPDVGRCYLLRPETPDTPLSHAAHLGSLQSLHPYLRFAVEQLIRHAAARGAEFKVISTVRAAKWTSRTRSERVKVGNRWKTVEETSTRYKGGGWHAFGLAVDVNLSHRKDLGSATSAYLRGGPERTAWLELGAQGESFGLIWIGRNDPGEIFHFEWHPGWPGLPRGALFQRLAGKADRDGIPTVWDELRFDAARETAFLHLRDAAGAASRTGPPQEEKPSKVRPAKRRPRAKASSSQEEEVQRRPETSPKKGPKKARNKAETVTRKRKRAR